MKINCTLYTNAEFYAFVESKYGNSVWTSIVAQSGEGKDLEQMTFGENTPEIIAGIKSTFGEENTTQPEQDSVEGSVVEKPSETVDTNAQDSEGSVDTNAQSSAETAGTNTGSENLAQVTASFTKALQEATTTLASTTTQLEAANKEVEQLQAELKSVKEINAKAAPLVDKLVKDYSAKLGQSVGEPIMAATPLDGKLMLAAQLITEFETTFTAGAHASRFTGGAQQTAGHPAPKHLRNN